MRAPSASNSLGDGYFGKLRLQSDWNPADCTLTGVDEDVTFSVNNNMLFLDADQQVPLVDKISSLRFLFYDQNNSPITDPSSQPASISFIHVEVDTVAINGFTTTISSAATVRR